MQIELIKYGKQAQKNKLDARTNLVYSLTSNNHGWASVFTIFY